MRLISFLFTTLAISALRPMKGYLDQSRYTRGLDYNAKRSDLMRPSLNDFMPSFSRRVYSRF